LPPSGILIASLVVFAILGAPLAVRKFVDFSRKIFHTAVSIKVQKG
jgi:hypothetical protein